VGDTETELKFPMFQKVRNRRVDKYGDKLFTFLEAATVLAWTHNG